MRRRIGTTPPGAKVLPDLQNKYLRAKIYRGLNFSGTSFMHANHSSVFLTALQAELLQKYSEIKRGQGKNASRILSSSLADVTNARSLSKRRLARRKAVRTFFQSQGNANIKARCGMEHRFILWARDGQRGEEETSFNEQITIDQQSIITYQQRGEVLSTFKI